ncbi:hypothetical protein KIN20_026078 [Parelaphostrongylus tenuis]|uniref:DJ-1/PfpI domain-containing protein n=1 Tax=Parelaphostrongylus tenuis TaxID=148309 RepID=A0AAD5N049_PARTN|nr:hypothetical protein KIN20_026078 [Parelaphostrongylus tenuis]
MVTSLIKLSSRGVRSLHPTNFRSPWPFVKKGAYGQRKIGPFNYEKHKWPGQNREFPELSPKWHKENPKELNRYTGVQDEGYVDPVTGKYVVVPEMQSCLVVPNLDGFKLKPYVSFRTDVEIEKRRRAYAAKMNVGLHQKWMQRRCLSFAMEGRSEKLLRMSALVILADGAEEMEAVITIDVLRRGGVDVTVAGLTGSNPVKCSRKTVITPDCALKDVLSKTFSVVILPGGQPGSNTLAAVGLPSYLNLTSYFTKLSKFYHLSV